MSQTSRTRPEGSAIRTPVSSNVPSSAAATNGGSTSAERHRELHDVPVVDLGGREDQDGQAQKRRHREHPADAVARVGRGSRNGL